MIEDDEFKSAISADAGTFSVRCVLSCVLCIIKSENLLFTYILFLRLYTKMTQEYRFTTTLPFLLYYSKGVNVFLYLSSHFRELYLVKE